MPARRQKRNPETERLRGVKEALEAAGYLVRRVHSGKVKSRHGGWMHLAEAGTSDLVVQGTGVCGWMEVKFDDEVQTQEQVDFCAAVVKRRGWYDEVQTQEQVDFCAAVVKRRGWYGVVHTAEEALRLAAFWTAQAALAGAA